MAGILSWIAVIVANIGILAWLAVDRKVTVLQSQYATLSGPQYQAYWNLYYQPPWSRCGTYAMGILAAYAMRSYMNSNRRIPKWGYLIGWIISATLALAVLYGKIPMEKDVDKYLNGPRDIMYLMFDRYVWSVCVLFVVFACQTVSFSFLRYPNLFYHLNTLYITNSGWWWFHCKLSGMGFLGDREEGF